MKLFFVIVLCLCFENVFSQFKEIDVKVIYSSKAEALYTLRDSLLQNGQGTLETERINIFLKQAFVNKKTNELKIQGKLCGYLDSTNNCIGDYPSFLIFVGEKKGNIITDTVKVVGFNYEKADIEQGRFTFSIKMKKGTYLYFYSPGYYIEEFSIKKIMCKLNL